MHSFHFDLLGGDFQFFFDNETALDQLANPPTDDSTRYRSDTDDKKPGGDKSKWIPNNLDIDIKISSYAPTSAGYDPIFFGLVKICD